VVSEQHIQSVFLIELPKQIECGGVGRFDVPVIGMFPELVPVAHLDVSAVVAVIIIQSVLIDVPISPELVGKAVVSSVNIAEKYKAGAVVKGNGKSLFEYLI